MLETAYERQVSITDQMPDLLGQTTGIRKSSAALDVAIQRRCGIVLLRSNLHHVNTLGQWGRSWRCVETYIKVKGRWTHLYRAVDKLVERWTFC